ncbi:cytosine permease [Paenibacillus sp. N1-5-1-14]|uniref:cytosine permease n=1 Tax=Paenibacillus radicibacter TaxID=2972488 RepID=UPI0021597916|nr:cytosine permease [Paenibacillus radicibacter]MCR8644592.1 cytosine permease [Paenibacillus radicibacter]
MSEVAQVQSNSSADYEREPVPVHLRKGWLSMSLVWIAIGIDLSAMFLGAELGAGMNLTDSLAATLIGSVILGLIGALCAYVGAKTGLSTAMISRFLFGNRGALVVSIVLGIFSLGWFGVQAGFFASNMQTAFQQLWGIDLSLGLLSFIGGMLMMSTAIWGYRSIERLSIWSVPLLIIFIGIAVYTAISTHGTAAMWEPISSSPIPFGIAVSLVIGIFIVGTVLSPDIARWARTPKHAVMAAFVGFFVGNSFMTIIAIVLSRIMDTSDLTNIFIMLGLGLPAIIVLTLAQWTTNTSNLYSASLGFSVVFKKVPKWLITVIAGVVATMLAVFGIYDKFLSFLNVITMFVSPIGGIYTAEYLLVDRKKFTFEGIDRNKNWVFRSLFVWTAATFFAYLTTPAGDGSTLFTVTSVPALDAFIFAFIVQWIIGKISVKKGQ